MRIAIFSDIHANFEALTAVLKAYEEHDVQKYICLGDVVGYGADPNLCCDKIRETADLSVMGNHDAAVAGKMSYDYYYEACRLVLDQHHSVLTQENLQWLTQRPYSELHEYDGLTVGFSHGSPVRPQAFEYIFYMEHVKALLEHFDELPDVSFIGHSHLCKFFAIHKDTKEVFAVHASTFPIKPEYKYIINVGSVGQPRDNNNKSAFTIFDTSTRIFECKRVEYDIETAARKILQANQDKNFANRLWVGI